MLRIDFSPRVMKHAAMTRSPHQNIFLTLVCCCLALCVLCSPAMSQAAEMQRFSLGDAKLMLGGPEGHAPLAKKQVPALLLVPDRYRGLLKHVLSFYAAEAINKPSKIYNNHGALFYMGSSKKTWSKQDLTELKTKLMPGAQAEGGELKERQEFMRRFLKQEADFAISRRKAEKYYDRLQQCVVLDDGEQGLVLGCRHKKKGEKDKYVTMSLTLVRDKLIGTAYYQVAPGRKERSRAAQMTRDWQKALLEANADDAP